METKKTKSFLRGAAVRAFYDMNKHPDGYRFVRLQESLERTDDMPIIGLSTGWFPATVAEEFNGEGEVLVRFHGSFEDPYSATSPEQGPVKNLHWRVDPNLVSERTSKATSIELSLVVVRWKEYFTRHYTSRSHNVLNEDLIKDVLEGPGSVKEALGSKGKYEVFTIFASKSKHLDLLDSSKTKQIISSLRGSRKAALYFLWPTQKPALEREGRVAAGSLQGLMQRMEDEGVKTSWPHPWKLYEDLLSKSWAFRESKMPTGIDLRIPPTTAVSREELSLDAEAAASTAIRKLQELRKQRGGTPASKEDYRGVAKLGFAWMGEEVLPFTGEAALTKALKKLLDGSIPEAHCLVQERVEDVCCEMRAYCCQDAERGTYAIKLLNMRMRPPKHQHQAWDASFAMADHRTMTSDELAQQCFAGDRKIVENIEAEVKRLAYLWLEWLRNYSPPSVVRIDFMISQRKDLTGSSGAFQVHTCELTECGGATCGLQVTPRTVAVLNDAMGEAEGFPKPLPPFQETNERNEQRNRNDRDRPKRAEASAEGVRDVQLPVQGRSFGVLGAFLLAFFCLLWPRSKLGGFVALAGIGMWKARDKLRDSWTIRS
ncbi:unnamed protein product [Durusdinium trenchii]|uniref:NEDD8-activating enzyme E1 regulatory subunit n=2 Tax=Durusdinium trenchii TaxID=1381693 RepID=A0ABP0Q5C1_9DINO